MYHSAGIFPNQAGVTICCQPRAAWVRKRHSARHALNSLSFCTATQTCSFPHAQTLNIMKKINPDDRHEPQVTKKQEKVLGKQYVHKKSCFQLYLCSVDIKYIIYFCKVRTLLYSHFTSVKWLH